MDSLIAPVVRLLVGSGHNQAASARSGTASDPLARLDQALDKTRADLKSALSDLSALTNARDPVDKVEISETGQALQETLNGTGLTVVGGGALLTHKPTGGGTIVDANTGEIIRQDPPLPTAQTPREQALANRQSAEHWQSSLERGIEQLFRGAGLRPELAKEATEAFFELYNANRDQAAQSLATAADAALTSPDSEAYATSRATDFVFEAEGVRVELSVAHEYAASGAAGANGAALGTSAGTSVSFRSERDPDAAYQAMVANIQREMDEGTIFTIQGEAVTDAETVARTRWDLQQRYGSLSGGEPGYFHSPEYLAKQFQDIHALNATARHIETATGLVNDPDYQEELRAIRTGEVGETRGALSLKAATGVPLIGLGGGPSPGGLRLSV